MQDWHLHTGGANQTDARGAAALLLGFAGGTRCSSAEHFVSYPVDHRALDVARPSGVFLFCFVFFIITNSRLHADDRERHVVLGVTAYAVTGLIYSGVCDNHEANKNQKSTEQISPRNLTILLSTQTDCEKKYKPYALSLKLNCLIFFLTTQRVSTHFSRALLRVFMFS